MFTIITFNFDLVLVVCKHRAHQSALELSIATFFSLVQQCVKGTWRSLQILEYRNPMGKSLRLPRPLSKKLKIYWYLLLSTM